MSRRATILTLSDSVDVPLDTEEVAGALGAVRELSFAEHQQVAEVAIDPGARPGQSVKPHPLRRLWARVVPRGFPRLSPRVAWRGLGAARDDIFPGDSARAGRGGVCTDQPDEYFQYDTFIARWDNQSLHGDAYGSFSVGPDGKVESLRMKRLSPNTVVSFDYHDLDLTRVAAE